MGRATFESTPSVECAINDRLESIAAHEWNQLNSNHDPFLSHEFLVALERHACLGEGFGWFPNHLTVKDSQGRLVGAMPMYLKTNSYGEFVFDWSWASAFGRYGLSYYPKLVVAIPYTPVTGHRLMVHPKADSNVIKPLMIDQALGFARAKGVSGLHWLFTNDEDSQLLTGHSLILRMGCQYHWHNNNYQDFEQFLQAITSRKRKNVRRERRKVKEQDIQLKIMHGYEADDELWRQVHRFYTLTFDRKFGIPTLTLGFFKEIAKTMGNRVVLMLAEYEGSLVACAINFRNDTCLYGRYWGCEQKFHSLHFETCYYQGINYCIEHNLKCFEPGAQGEHKIPRGFLPTKTYSAHWIAHEGFRRILHDFCKREQRMMEQECNALMTLSPYRQESLPPGYPQ
jgi:predicted N-acyltransferase